MTKPASSHPPPGPPITVTVFLRERLGNNLFQYALGRIIAEHHGWAMDCRRFPDRSNLEVLQGQRGAVTSLFTHADAFPAAPLSLEGARHAGPRQDFMHMQPGGWDGMTLDLDAILGDPSPRHIRLGGFFQRAAYFLPHRDRIRTWLSGPAPRLEQPIGEDDVVINVRGGHDFRSRGWEVDPRYYLDALERLDRVGQIHVTGIDIPPGLHAALEQYKPAHYHAGPIDQLRFIGLFRRMVIPNSTFSWWAAFLSQAEQICVPAPEGPGFHFSSPSLGVELALDGPAYVRVPASFLPAD